MAFVLIMAEWTGLEPATPGVTGRYSNQLNYHSLLLDYYAIAARDGIAPSARHAQNLVGADGFEPPTFAL